MKSVTLCIFGFLAVSGCSGPPQSAPRFTHIDTTGLAAPFVMFDQKTGQVCWGAYKLDPSSAGTGSKATTVKLNVGPLQDAEMPYCGDLN
jgi:hypothetical protein